MKDLYWILSGKTVIRENGLAITVGPFSFLDHYNAESFAEDQYNTSFIDGDLTLEESILYLKDLGLWSEEDELNLEQIPKNIEQMKLDYYNLFYRDCTSYIKDNIRLQEYRLNELINRKNYLFRSTCESIREQSKIFWLIENCSNIDGLPIDWSKLSLMNLTSKFSGMILSSETIRQIAKSNEFKSIWQTHKRMVEDAPFSEMKTVLIHWAMVYDNVYESMDCPSDQIIEDDIALDGWFLFQRKKREEERKKNNQDNVTSKMSKAGEIFLPVSSAQEIMNIHDMNSPEAKRKLNLLNKDLNKHGAIDDIKLSSNLEQVGIAKNKAMFNSARK